MKKRWIIITVIIGIVLIGAVAAGPIMSNVATPTYEVTTSEGNIEIRRYKPMIIAEVQIDGQRKDTIGDGFRLLADYIFGNNTVRQDIAMTAPVQQQQSTKIAMTAPVQQQQSTKIAMTAPVQQRQSTKIAMTAPVQQQQSTKIAMTAPVQQQQSTKIAMTAPVQQQSSGNSWKISFVMPAEYSIETLPKPLNEHITLNEVPAKQFVVITFTGTNSDKNMEEHEEKLMAYIQSKNLPVTGTPKYAFYNPPWTLPLMRRNEIMIEIQ